MDYTARDIIRLLTSLPRRSHETVAAMFVEEQEKTIITLTQRITELEEELSLVYEQSARVAELEAVLTDIVNLDRVCMSCIDKSEEMARAALTANSKGEEHICECGGIGYTAKCDKCIPY